MKVVIDTNVFVSGIFWKGTPLKVLEKWRAGDFQLVISSAILNEYQRVIDELTGRYPSSDAAAMMDLVKINAKMTNPVSLVRPVCTDHDDDKFLEAAVSSGAQYIVSGDKALLKVRVFRDVSIVTPAQFIRM